MSIRKVLGEPNQNEKNVLIRFEEEGTFEAGYEIEDINPNKRVGVPNTLIKIDCLYKNTTFVNRERMLKLVSESLDAIFAFDSFAKKINVAFLDKFDGGYKLGATYFLLSNVFKNEVNFYVYFNSLNGIKVFEELQAAIDVIKANKDYRNSSKDIFGTGALCPAQEAILEKTFNLKPDFTGKTLKIVDTHNLHHRNFHGIPDMRSPDDKPTAIIKAFTTFMKALKENPTDYVIFASEGGNAIRDSIFDEYKATRSETDNDLKFQINICNELTKKMGFSLVREPGFEADDIIGSYTRYFEKYGGEVIIISSDKDMYQLLSDKVKMYDTFNKRFISEEDWMKKFGVSPDKIVYSLAIQGDVSDNVPGIKGLGKVAAAKLINQFNDIDGIVNGASSLPENKTKEKLLAGLDDLKMSYELVRLYDFLADEADFNKFRFPSYNFFYLIEKELEELNININ